MCLSMSEWASQSGYGSLCDSSKSCIHCVFHLLRVYNMYIYFCFDPTTAVSVLALNVNGGREREKTRTHSNTLLILLIGNKMKWIFWLFCKRRHLQIHCFRFIPNSSEYINNPFTYAEIPLISHKKQQWLCLPLADRILIYYTYRKIPANATGIPCGSSIYSETL